MLGPYFPPLNYKSPRAVSVEGHPIGDVMATLIKVREIQFILPDPEQ